MSVPATISPDGKKGLISAAKGLALTILELLENPELLAAVKAEHQETIKKALTLDSLA